MICRNWLLRCWCSGGRRRGGGVEVRRSSMGRGKGEGEGPVEFVDVLLMKSFVEE